MLTLKEESRRLVLREKLAIAEEAKALLLAEALELKALDEKMELSRVTEDEIFPKFEAKVEPKFEAKVEPQVKKVK
jgi:hypothetical protein